MIFKATAAIALAICASPLAAQTAAPTVPAASPMSGHTTPGTLVTMAEWTERMHRVLANELHYPMPVLGLRPGSGTVSVKFNCSDNGRPDKVSVLKSSGDSLLDRAALSAVRRMASLHPLPTGFTPSQKFVALIVFANNASDPQLDWMAKEQTKRNRWYHDPVTASKSGPATLQVAAIR